ncbi:Ig-like domain repeat protein [Microlunatus capsulatus]|uniref:Uncharacterized protein n=1 Tax=Microlunatus capsulatus TaxID=99117 RepID=A0ABS4Z2T9_9ACTN|nr:Ig-like domain repeat protein [Microlunatus capsulatus]MBP2415367.1 hypothetical protein [Microlunatus capsulatus]
MTRAIRLALALLLSTAGLLIPLGALAPTASAAQGQLGAPQVVLNPGGGRLADGTDGLRFTINALSRQSDEGDESFDEYYVPGQDALFYRGTQQYCCSAGAPMLAVGGTAFGQAGPGMDVGDWSSLTVVSTGGSTSTDDVKPDRTGNASARVRYVATKNGLEYQVTRTVTYTYPNDFVTDSYAFVIPEGNTEPVKFYLGGDTAPGGSDQGYGVMLTSPVRSVISLNTSSQIQFGIREVPESKKFDGATSQSFYTPYGTVQTGGDIGFVATNQTHDAGLMVQWNLGSTPGTQTAALQQFVNKQGTNLSGGFDRTFTTAGQPVRLNLSVENTNLTAAVGLGYAVNLPTGTVLAPGTRSNTCGGTLTATDGGTSVTLTGASVGATANCVVGVPVVASTYGTYTLSLDNVASVTGGLNNNVGTTAFFVPLAPTYGDAALGDLTVGTATTGSVTAGGAPAPTYAVTTGALPAGLRLDGDTGVVTGTPTRAGTYSFTVTATNAGGTATRDFTGTVGRGTPGLTGSADPASAPFGSAVTLSAGDLPGSATGTLSFRSGETVLCSATLPATSCAVDADLEPGTYPVDLTYSGDANWAERTVALPAVAVTLAEASLSATLDDRTTEFGQRSTVEVALRPAGATGTVTVSAGALVLCEVTLPGSSSCRTPADLPVGTHTVTLSYAGDARYAPVAAGAGTLTVERATPALPPEELVTGTFGQPTTVSLPGLPEGATGRVTVFVDGREACSYDLGDDPESCDLPADLRAGEHVLRLDYAGDDRYQPATLTTDLVVDRASTALTTPATASGTYGSRTTVQAGGLPEGATGTVTVTVGGEVVCRFDVATATSCDLPADFPAGERSALVTYSGDDDHLGSSTTVELDVDVRPTAVEADAEVAAVYGAPATIAVDGLPAGATGLVTVTGGPAGTECTIDLDEDETSCATDGLTRPGRYTLTVRYAGDANHAPSVAEVVLEVAQQATTLETAATVAGTFGTGATVSFDGLPNGATGTVVVRLGERELCTVTVPGGVPCTLPADLPAGEHELEVAYSGDDNFAASTTTTTLTVGKRATTIGAIAPLTSVFGTAGQVQVVGLPEAATGTVTVTARSEDGDVLEVCTLDLDEDETTCPTPVDVDAGRYTLVVSYPGDANHEGTETTTTWEVGQAELTKLPASPTTTGTSGSRPEVAIAPLDGATGTVVVTYTGPDGTELPFCEIQLPGTTCTGPAGLRAGTYRLTFRYGGDANFAAATGETTLVVGPRSTQVTTEERFSSTEGQPARITFGGLPVGATGTVTVALAEPEAPVEVEAALRVPAAGEELCTVDVTADDGCSTPADLEDGSYDLVVRYGGDADHQPSEATTVLLVEPAVEEPTEPTQPAEPTQPPEPAQPADPDPAPSTAPVAEQPVSGGGTTGGGSLAHTGGPGLLLGLLGLALLGSGGAALLRARRRA